MVLSALLRKRSLYEMKQRDKILINYGNDSKGELLLKYNSVPDLPEDF